MVRKAQRELQAAQPASPASTDVMLTALGAALIALDRDTQNPEDRIHRRVPRVRTLLERALRHAEVQTDPAALRALYARLGADMVAEGLDPQRPGDVLRFALKETEE